MYPRLGTPALDGSIFLKFFFNWLKYESFELLISFLAFLV